MKSFMLRVEHRDANCTPMRFSQQGFSLLEVMAAIMVLAVGLLALSSMQIEAIQSNSFGNQVTEATILAQDKAEEMHLLNERYLANPAAGEPADIQDTQINWTLDTNGDGILDDFDWTNPEGTEGPIDATGAAVAVGGYTREWCIENDVPVVRAKTIYVRVRWRNNREVAVHTMLSQ